MSSGMSPGGWFVRQMGSYGTSAGAAVVDEAWKVAPETVEDGIEPTQPERVSPQLALVSTAHRQATRLMLSRRQDAIEHLHEPGDVLLVEWSADRGCDVEDRQAWRQASPHWTPARERLMDSKLRRALAGDGSDPDEQDPLESFRSQWLNQWPTTRRHGPGEPLLGEGVWDGLADLQTMATGPLVVAVEDRTGLGAAVAAAGPVDGGRILVWGRTFPGRQHAVSWASLLVERRAGCRLLVGPSLVGDEALQGFPVAAEKVTYTDTAVGVAEAA